ncbi:cytochrome c oxidase accessory protein CcoG [Aureimonas sp. SA4125]|uniref:cytochrome c oxidase accessory protein CcoG n=1 Tax=Aureimonas sp. SA4125 TaxID=2826993 RepID=UPI001CC41ADE|nr:cytochrome c oxidase accessory protein CcoG [Aureimonas sp. SA4125]BDA84176.1 cytochrome c oxidase accessory protein CcoG [Aureimonas sp. SA4125]
MLVHNSVDRLNAEPVNSADRRGPLFAAREKIHPKRAEGSYRRLKWIIMAVTLAIYYATPWIRWDRGEGAPDQAVLIDLAGRRFYFFFVEIWPQEFYYVAGLLIMAGLGLFLVTSVAGRAWCGYACPQTVWVDLFLVVERFFEGDRNKRIALDKAPMSPGKFGKRFAKHAVWLAIAVLTGGAWIFYFADAPTLLRDVVTLDASGAAYTTIAILTATTYVFGGFMREQVCTYMCPWPRIQAAMLDEQSLTVTYNDWRGEPRSRHQKKALALGQPVGDCVDCNACVAVCPMGIDIREGQQMECITCALCIDACDSVMDHLGRERGLISYATLADYDANMTLARGGGETIEPARVRDPVTGRLREGVAHFRWRHMARPRTLVYLVLWSAIGVGMAYSLATRDQLTTSVQHDRNPVYVLLSDGGVRNAYTVKIANMTNVPRLVTVAVEGLPGAVVAAPGRTLDGGGVSVEVPRDRVEMVRLLVSQPAAAVTDERQDFFVTVTDTAGGESSRAAAVFQSPEEARR